VGLLDQVGGKIRGILTSGIGNILGGAVDLSNEAFQKAFHEEGEPQKLLPEVVQGAGLPVPDGSDPKSLFYDPFSILDQMGYRDRPSGLSYTLLEELSRRVAIYGAIVQIRVADMSNFSVPQIHNLEAGYRIAMRNRSANAGKKDKIKMLGIEEWIGNCGSTQEQGKDNFEIFLKKILRDSLIYDQVSFEIRHNRKGQPCDFYAVDGSSIRLADVPRKDDDRSTARYVQIYDEVPIAEFAKHELCFGVRNPRTGIRYNGYGYSEIEMLIEVITSLLFGFSYNSKFFQQGTVSKGLLNFKGFVPPERLQEFRRNWYSMISGVANAWRTPALNVPEGVDYINMHTNNRDMEFSEWMNFLIKLTCGMALFDPAELNFLFGNAGQSQQMFQSPAESRIKQSRDRGLRPILRSVANWVNEYVIWPLNPEYCLTFTGLDIKDAGQLADTEKKTVTYLKTVDEMRAEHDMPKMKNGKGEVILDATWLQFSTMIDQQLQQEEQAQQGMPAEGPPDRAPPPSGGGPGGEEEEAPDDGSEEEEPQEEPEGPEEDQWGKLLSSLGKVKKSDNGYEVEL
jgi:hypothetical protein